MGTTRQRWLVKQEPSDFSWETFLTEGATAWTGVRNPQARIHLRGMRPGDEVLFYHSGDEKAVVGLAVVQREAYPDPTDKTGSWVAVDLAPVGALPKRVSLADIKKETALADLGLVRQSRLSVMPVGAAHWRRLTQMAGWPGARD